MFQAEHFQLSPDLIVGAKHEEVTGAKRPKIAAMDTSKLRLVYSDPWYHTEVQGPPVATVSLLPYVAGTCLPHRVTLTSEQSLLSSDHRTGTSLTSSSWTHDGTDGHPFNYVQQ